MNHLVPRFGLFLPTPDSRVTRGCDPARCSICTHTEDPIGDDGMMHLGSTRHGPPRFIKVKEPHVVRIYSPVDVDIKIANIGSEVVGWSSDVLVGLGCVPNRVSGGTRGEWTLLFERKEAILALGARVSGNG